jgi:predicted ArsR family transcriptional regulator
MLYCVAASSGNRNNPEQLTRIEAALERADQVRRLLSIPGRPRARTLMERQIDELEDFLERNGFDSKVETESMQVRLHNCPFADLAKNHPQVCEVHFGC